ncbi:hypothetical protein PRIPAC_77186 [Pristionchus pacificus]|uniref:Uncharacterized protein n=1 Tax=Pristionchus pacificus TaxID=54126 RepID=A0A2A6CQM6_PRIPA|nr:hypothetical protein PRIPAC_77186 [Pristionchus pacificus]|eukprot:PDM80341.1 hypothetical protein PRIPAC_32920 [Pristionchus pacificus]
MIYHVLVFLVCLDITRACLPMQPADDMPCPSLAAIQAGAAPGYATSPLQASTINGAKVYKCTAPEKLLSVDGGTVTELADGATISCQPNSAIFTTADGKAVGNKKFVCGEVVVPCPGVPEHTGAAPTDVMTSPLMMSMSNGDSIWQCGAAPNAMYKLVNGDPTMATKLTAGAHIKCKRQSGKLTLVEGTETDLDPASTDKYMCGTLACQLCDMAKIVDKTVASCATQPDIFCTNKPIVTNNAAGCPMVECTDTADALYLIDALNSMIATPANVKCDGNTGFWSADGTNAIPANSVGFVCGKPATCNNCHVKVTDVYSGTATSMMVTDTVVAAKPTCTYKCPQNFQLKVNNDKHSAAVCSMDTEVVTVDTPGGAMLSTTNKFTCEECTCMRTLLTDGAAGLCAKGRLCTMPTASVPCLATCPGNSVPTYWDANKMVKTAPSIPCEGSNWIEPGVDTMGGITCEFPVGSGFTSTPPAGFTACTTPAVLPCGVCNTADLVYVPSGTGYYLTCLKGSLVTDKATGLTTTCSELGTWNEGIILANCINPTETSQVSDCLTSMTDPSVMNNVDFECTLGKCYLSCKGANQQFQYETDAVHMNKYLRCLEFEVYAIDETYIVAPANIKCV